MSCGPCQNRRCETHFDFTGHTPFEFQKKRFADRYTPCPICGDMTPKERLQRRGGTCINMSCEVELGKRLRAASS